MAHIQEVAQLHKEHKEVKAKWVELHDVVTVAASRESTLMAQINNLEASVCSKTKEATTADEKRAIMDERFKKVMEQNQRHATTNTELYSRINIVRSENVKLQSKIDKL